MSKQVKLGELVAKENSYLMKAATMESLDNQLNDLLARRLKVRQDLCALEQWFMCGGYPLPDGRTR
jgi:hypothetical protein